MPPRGCNPETGPKESAFILTCDAYVPVDRRLVDVPGFQNWTPHRTLVTLVFCLILLVTSIGMSVKYIQVSRELQQLSTDHITQNSSLAQSIQSREDLLRESDMRRQQSKQEVEKVLQELNRYNDTLQQYKQTLKESEEKQNVLQKVLNDTKAEKQNTEQELKKTHASLNQLNKEYCPDQWTFFGGRCFYFSDEKKQWTESRNYCAYRGSTLLILTEKDTALKTFISEKNDDYWVGLQRKNWDYEWKWLDGSPG
ncbi:hypothetical protein FKM82_027965 [Ascaphus truei]